MHKLNRSIIHRLMMLKIDMPVCAIRSATLPIPWQWVMPTHGFSLLPFACIWMNSTSWSVLAFCTAISFSRVAIRASR